MCGLVGIMSSNMLHKHKDVLTSLLYLDTWRGKDSTGVAAIRQNADTEILKSTVPGYEFIESEKYSQLLKYTDFVWIGHNRYGTVGKNTKTNAHPFEVLDEQGGCILVGAHNGTLLNKHDLTDHIKFGTDSEAFFNEIATSGLEEAVGKVRGAWAVVYYDHIEEELRMFRNKERPLFYAFEEGKKTVFWASEIWMLRVAVSRAGLKLHEDKVHEVVEDTLYRIPAHDKLNEELVVHAKGGLVGKTSGFFQNGRWTEGSTGGGTAAANQKPQPKRAETPQEAVARQREAVNRIMNMRSGTSQQENGGKPNPTKDNSVRKRLGLNNNVISIDNAKNFKGYGGALLSRIELIAQLSNGCSWCETEEIHLSDKDYGWLEHDKPVCSKCISGVHEEPKKEARTVH